eukprot:NODE_12_length_45166_cov_0.552511.p10 type:complete len:329 gc:universal NODE_12_length_45166_cov_0.552511:23144-24130(+)
MKVLPVDILYEIFQYLDISDVVKIKQLNKQYLHMFKAVKWRIQIQQGNSNIFYKSDLFHVFKLSLDAFHLECVNLKTYLRELTLLNCKLRLDYNSLVNIRKLSLISCKKVVIDLPKLEYLNLSYSECKIINCENVFHLDISYTKVNKLPHTTRLKYLFMDHTSITDVSHLNKLEMLSVEGSNIESLPKTGHLLNFLNISHIPITETQIIQFLPTCKNLNILELEHMIITSLTLDCIISNRIPLHELNLNETNVFTHDLIYLLSNSSSSLKSLSIDSTRVDKRFIDFLIDSPTNLTNLSALDIHFDLVKINYLKSVNRHLMIHVTNCFQ